MLKDDVKEYLIDFQKRGLPQLIERDVEIAKTKRIKTIIGPRRVGKTFFMFQKMKELLAAGTKREEILYLNFEDPRLIESNFKEIRDIIKLHWEIFPSAKELHIFIDEPQNIKNWEVAVRSLHDEGFDIFLTGSSSKLLSKEIATSLRGRTLTYLLLPFSFKEFLRLKGFAADPLRLSSRERSLLMNLYNEYLEFGGFPEIASETGRENKLRMINEYFDLVVYKDIVERYKIKNVMLIKWLVRSLVSSFSKEFSAHKIYLSLKSKGLRLSKNTLYAYLSMLQDTMFVFFLPHFDWSIKRRELSINKVYLCDTCFTKLSEVSGDIGRKMENIVFLELKRRLGPISELFYWQDVQGKEVDFVIKEGRIKQLIQVCRNIDDFDVKKRELSALLKASKELKCKNLLVITEDYEAKEKHDGKTIAFIPLWKWLLQ
jgi:predicted AAA+ superfamily ATPase